ncbi:uncharacterized protein LOC133525551 isoform X1 [Cydia pomonella]|uniref:uncharacterized protein LOC133525551 isoform X1 n=1 Tax=Cydia pomonella TaxID=82600 RepID=UPI002ADD7235|nr:uncharacterized protein LOC133525551 isoform X1 [Cydia pomonella]
MKTARVAVLALLAAGLISAEIQNLDLLRLLMERPMLSGHNRFDRGPSIEDRVDQLWHRKYGEDNRYSEGLSGTSTKRSAVATALNAGRPRRQPAPALGILNDMENFFESLRGNLALQASLSPDERAHFYEPPTVVQPPSSGGGGGSGMRKLHALRPLRPTGNIRSYNRRSLVEDHIYPGANRHDPGLLWAGLGR